ncbi:MAG: PEFG-CTERM sorting domain-containing protein [Nitrososphaera sp.]|nr:PEFG-CTERM sorting domain-containing protein [Nitrososphaera sp.]
MDYKAYALMAILLTSVASVALVGTAHAQTSSVTVQTDQPGYEAGDNITITGTVTNIQAGTPVLIRVLNPLDTLARTDTVDVAADGSWNYTFPSGGPLMLEPGDYRVIANYRTVSAETTFDFEPGEVWRTWNISIAGNSYVIRYQITGGTVSNMAADVELATLTVTIASTSNGSLKLDLPRNVIQSLSVPNVPTGGSDIDYEVFIDGVPGVIESDEMSATSRILTIPFEAGAEEIEVIGTWIVPEFGAIAAIVLAVAIVGIIVATTRYGKFNSFLPKH